MTTPPVTPAARPHPLPAPPAPPPTEGILPAGDIIDLDSARRTRRRPALRNSGWVCRECDLSAGPFWPAEAAMLAALHDQVLRHPPSTALPVPRCPIDAAIDGLTVDDAIIDDLIAE